MYVCMQLYMQAGLNCRLSWSYQLDASRSCWWKRLSATPLGLHLKQRPPRDGKGRRPVIHHHRWSHSWSYVYARARQRPGRLLRAPLSYSKLMSWNDYCHSLWTEWQPIAIYILLCLISVSATPSGWVMPILWESSIGIICVSANIKLTDTMYACFVTAATYTYVWHALYVLISLYNYNYCVYSTSFRRFRGRVLSIYIRALICIHRQVSLALINT